MMMKYCCYTFYSQSCEMFLKLLLEGAQLAYGNVLLLFL